MDKRYEILKERLSLLSIEELQRIKENIDHVCFDTYNYDKENNKFCPLAIALNLHKTTPNPSNVLITLKLAERFDPVNVIGGVEGNYYTGQHRREDLLALIDELIK